MRARYVQVDKARRAPRTGDAGSPEPKAGEVRVRVEACGVCHSDSVTIAGLFPFVTYPRVPGHEIVGRVDSVGDGCAAVEGPGSAWDRLVRRTLPQVRTLPSRRSWSRARIY